MTRIEDWALIGDLHTAALVSRDGSIDWLCLPHFDSPACFAAMLDSPEAGRWQIAPVAGGSCRSRRYRPGTLILETEWETDSGAVRVTDLMPVRGEAADVVRIVRGLRGTVAVRSELRLRFDYGQVVPWVRRDDHGISAVAGPDSAWLRSPAAMTGVDHTTVSELEVAEGAVVPFVLTWAPSHHPAPAPVDAEQALADTEEFWTGWSARSECGGVHREAVQRSLITLKALTFAPTGGLVAAATTSLPEQVGGERNWDYRYCWLRDASLSLQALLAGGYSEEATAWRQWLLRSVAGDPSQLQTMYALDGARRLTEQTLPWLAGFEGSTPVRIGNAAADQLQLDVWGEVLNSLALTRDAALHQPDESWDIQVALMEHLESVWREPDNGIWEVRGPRQHFTYSKVMAWVAADRMVHAVQEHGLPGPADRWAAMRDEVHADVLARGWDEEQRAFTQAYGSGELDATALLFGRLGFLPPGDRRMVDTVRAVQRDLTDDGLVLRYRPASVDDGLGGQGEGVFLACSFWLVDALVGIGERAEAEQLFERLLSLRNDVGLLSEEYDPRARRQLGNTPQAFSHLALVMSALALDEGQPRHADDPTGERSAA